LFRSRHRGNKNKAKTYPPNFKTKYPQTTANLHHNQNPKPRITNKTNFRHSKIIIMQLTAEVQLLKSRQALQTRGERLHAIVNDIVVCNK
jgi:hypothetical protein